MEGQGQNLFHNHADASLQQQEDAAMSSQFTDFIINNTAIDNPMDNEDQDLSSKGDPSLPELVKYLSCPQPSKDAQPMSLDDKSILQDANFNPGQLLAPDGLINSTQLKGLPDSQFAPQPVEGSQMQNIQASQFPAPDGSFVGGDAGHQGIVPVQTSQQQVSSQQEVLGKQSSLYPEHNREVAVGNSNPGDLVFSESQTLNSSAFDTVGNHQRVPNHNPIGGVETQGVSEPCFQSQFQPVPINANEQFHPHQAGIQSQFNNTDLSVTNFQNQTQTQDPSLMSAFGNSSEPQTNFIPDQTNLSQLDFGLVTHSLLNSTSVEGSDFKPPEKMHVDEEFSQAVDPNLSHFQHNFQTKLDNTFSQDSFQTKAPASVSLDSSFHIDSGVYDQTLSNVAASQQQQQQTSEYTTDYHTGQGLSSNVGQQQQQQQQQQQFNVGHLQQTHSESPSLNSQGMAFSNTSHIQQGSPQASTASEFSTQQQSPAQSTGSTQVDSQYTSPQESPLSNPNGSGYAVHSPGYQGKANFSLDQTVQYQGSPQSYQGSPASSANPPTSSYDAISVQQSPSAKDSMTQSPGYAQEVNQFQQSGQSPSHQQQLLQQEQQQMLQKQEQLQEQQQQQQLLLQQQEQQLLLQQQQQQQQQEQKQQLLQQQVEQQQLLQQQKHLQQQQEQQKQQQLLQQQQEQQKQQLLQQQQEQQKQQQLLQQQQEQQLLQQQEQLIQEQQQQQLLQQEQTRLQQQQDQQRLQEQQEHQQKLLQQQEQQQLLQQQQEQQLRQQQEEEQKRRLQQQNQQLLQQPNQNILSKHQLEQIHHQLHRQQQQQQQQQAPPFNSQENSQFPQYSSSNQPSPNHYQPTPTACQTAGEFPDAQTPTSASQAAHAQKATSSLPFTSVQQHFANNSSFQQKPSNIEGNGQFVGFSAAGGTPQCSQLAQQVQAANDEITSPPKYSFPNVSPLQQEQGAAGVANSSIDVNMAPCSTAHTPESKSVLSDFASVDQLALEEMVREFTPQTVAPSGSLNVGADGFANQDYGFQTPASVLNITSNITPSKYSISESCAQNPCFGLTQNTSSVNSSFHLPSSSSHTLNSSFSASSTNTIGFNVNSAPLNSSASSFVNASSTNTTHSISDITPHPGFDFKFDQSPAIGAGASSAPISSSVASETFTAAGDFPSSFPFGTTGFATDKVKCSEPMGSSDSSLRQPVAVATDSFPQPMQVQDSSIDMPMELTPHSGMSLEGQAASGEAKPEGYSSSMSYEEIHMSIVEAGNALAKTEVSSSFPTHAVSKENPVKLPGSFSFSNNTSMGILSSSSNVTNQASTSSRASTVLLPGVSPNPNILTIFKGIQVPPTQLPMQPVDTVNTHTPATVPNFLENPAIISCIRTSNPENVSLIASHHVTQSQPQTRFVTMIAASPANSTPVVTSSGAHQPIVAVRPNPGLVLTQQPLFQATTQERVSQIPSVTAGQPVTVVSTTASSMITLYPLSNLVNCVESPTGRVAAETVTSTKTFSALPSQQLESRTSVMPIVTNPNASNQSALPPQVQKPNFGSMATVVIPTSSSSGTSNGQPNQPHIILSLEDLQKLLAHQKLAASTNVTVPPPPMPLAPQIQPQAPSQPQMLLVQSPTSQAPRQVILQPPRLMLRSGAAKMMLPQQQLQQTREQLQLLVQPVQQQQQPAAVPVPTTAMAAQDVPIDFGKPMQSFKLLALTQDQQQQQQPQIQGQKLQLPHQAQQATLPSLKRPLSLAATDIHQDQLVQQAAPQFISSQQQVLAGTEQKANPTQLQQPATQQLPSGIQEPTASALLQSQLKQQILPANKDLHQQQLKQQQLLQQQSQPQDKPAHSSSASESLRKDFSHLHKLLTGEKTDHRSFGNGMFAAVRPLNLPTATDNSTHALNATSNAEVPTSTLTFFSTNNRQEPVFKGFSPAISKVSIAPDSFAMANTVVKSVASSTTTNTGFFSRLAVSGTSETQSGASSTPFHFQFQDRVMDKEHKLDIPKRENELPDIQGMELGAEQNGCRQPLMMDAKRPQSPLSIDLSSPPNSPLDPPSPASPVNPCEDLNTQATLVERSADLHIKSDTMLDMEDNANDSFDLSSKRPSACEESHSKDGESVPLKIHKSSLESNTHSANRNSPESAFDIGSVVSSTSSFSFGLNPGGKPMDVFTFGSSTVTEALPGGSKVCLKSSVPTQSVKPQSRKQKDQSLKAYCSNRLEGMELKILEQPEPQHRARYQTEGSRGAIKDASQQGFPMIKLFGYNKPARLQVFIGDECGRVKPHGFYQACRVFGKNSTSCVELEIEGTTVIELEVLPASDMTVKLDCIGILKLRNADVERRIGPKRARDKKKNNTRARLVMRTFVEKEDNSQHVLQVVSNPIVCTQPVGQPEISRMSLTESRVKGEESLFIIGKNFKNKTTTVLFQELDSSELHVQWQAEAEIEAEYFQPTHLICKIPPYKDPDVQESKTVQIVISCAGKKSDPHRFTYRPVFPVLPSVKQEIPKQEVPMDIEPPAAIQPPPFLSPEALQLNRMVEETQSAISRPTSPPLFQLPPGTVSQLAAQQEAVAKPPSLSSSPVVKPPKLNYFSQPSSSAMVESPTSKSASSASALPTFLLDERPDGLVSKSASEFKLLSPPVFPTASADAEGCPYTEKGSINSSQQDLNVASYVLNSPHGFQPCPSGSAANPSLVSPSQVGPSSSAPSKPFVVLVDPATLQSQDGGEKIQQLLQQILHSQR